MRDTKASPSVLCTIPKSLLSSEKLKAENVNVNVNVNVQKQITKTITITITTV